MRRFGVQAPRLAIRPQMPWYLRWCGIACGVLASAALLWLAYHYGQSYAEDETSRSQPTAARPSPSGAEESANAALKSELAAVRRELQIERAAQVDLARQMKALAQENAQLKEDIAVLQAISAPASKTDGISVSSARVEPSPATGEYTYRIVLVQTGSRAKPFQGNYELVVNLVRNGLRSGLTLPGTSDEASAAYKLDFRIHQRIDGTFRVEPGAEVKSVQLRVFEGEQRQPKIMQTVTLS
jgi:hypothetical protein